MPESIIRRILNKIKWDTEENISDYEIVFLHRGAPNDLKTYPAERIKEIKASYIVFYDDEAEDEEVIIPFHRIRRIYNKAKNEIIWEK
ncbi:MAG: DUF504 domain-containing protein [Candidatus Helarchaeota archaeon]